MNLVKWSEYFSKMKDMKVEIRRFSQYPFERNFSEIVRAAIDGGFDYMFQYDADMIGDKKIIEKLVAHDKECVGAAFYSRQAPHKVQMWDVEEDKDGEISYFYQYNREAVKKAIEAGCLVRTDVRGGGFTLFKVSALRKFSYPYARFKYSRLIDGMVHGIDMDITWKITKEYGGVYTDFDQSLDVKHITFKSVTSDDH